jgi:hypothetical protein
VGSLDNYFYAINSGTNGGLVNSAWPKRHHDSLNTGNKMTGIEETETVTLAADTGLINRYAYVFDGTDYVIIDPEDTATLIQPWQGFWAGTSQNVDLLIPKNPLPPAVPPDPGLDLMMLQNKWYLVSAPLNPTTPELSSVF